MIFMNYEDKTVKLRIFFLTLVVGLLIGPSAFAQTALTSTTLAEAVDGTETSIDVASATGVQVGDIAVVDREAMLVTAVNSTDNRITVTRGMEGTLADDHANARTIYIDPPGFFIQRDLAGACTAGSEFPNYTPLINLRNGRRYVCTDSYWREVLWQEFTIGQAQALDASIIFDGNAQNYHLGLDDTADDFVFGVGDVLGTTTAFSIGSTQVTTFVGDVIVGGTTPLLTVGDAGAEDAQLIFDGNATDFSFGLDDSADDLVFSGSTSLGTDNLFALPEVGTGVSQQRAIFYGANPATAADNDESYISFFAENDAAAQVEIGRISWAYLDVSAADDDSELTFDVFVGNTFLEVLTAGPQSITVSAPIVSVPPTDTGNDGVGPSFLIGQNNNTTVSNSGSLSFIDDGGTQQYLWVDNSASPGDLRIHTSPPGGATSDTAGDVVGGQSSPRFVKDILFEWTDEEAIEVLNAVIETPVYDFTYKNKKSKHVFTGIAIEDGEVPWYGYNPANGDDIAPPGTAKNLNEVNVAGYMILSIRALNAKIEEQQVMMTQLQDGIIKLQDENLRLTALRQMASRND